MKKILIFLLAALLTLSLCACGDTSDDPADTGETGTKEEITTSGGVIIQPSGNTATTVKLNANTEDIKLFGARESASDSVLNCNTPGAGFEIVIDGDGGVVNVRTQTVKTVSFRVWVDGEACKNADGGDYFEVNGVKNIEIPAVTAGKHTIRVIRVSDKSAGTAIFYNISFEGEQETIEESNETPLFIEFIGDGITGGAGLGGDREDATQAYAYLTANAMNADYAIAAFAGQGLTVGESPIASNYAKDGNYDAKADIVVVNVGAEDFAQTGDNAVDADAFTTAYKNFLKAVRAQNGSSCKIVCVSTSSNEALNTAIASACEALGGNQAGYYGKALTASAATNPTAAEHAAYATELATYLNSIKDDVISLKTLDRENAGYGEEVDYDSADWNS
ncbi:MAG: hypothetical protein IJW55_04290 [Clostridia bacterium]|nr:hypothetical protein [Clostridia bacterium]